MKPILEIQNIGKRYTITHGRDPYLSLRDRFSNMFKPRNSSEAFWALQDINFNIYPGESLGVIGKNGAGKSTLLKILSKITPPTKGKIICRGRIASLLEVGTGFHHELTGRENIYLNGSILGLKRSEIAKHFDAIVDFSGVEKFIDSPLKRYSSGMQLRLAFAVAAHLEPEILIIDEVLAVGDAEFQKKCLGKMGEVSNSGRTVIFVSHDLNAVSSLCSKCIVLQKGSVMFDGSTRAGIDLYLSNNLHKSQYIATQNQSKGIGISKVLIVDNSNAPKNTFLLHENVNVAITLAILDRTEVVSFFITVLDEKKIPVCSFETSEIRENLHLRIKDHFLTRGTYTLHMFVNQPNVTRWDELYDICFFEIIDNGSIMQKHGTYNYGNVFGYGDWL